MHQYARSTRRTQRQGAEGLKQFNAIWTGDVDGVGDAVKETEVTMPNLSSSQMEGQVDNDCGIIGDLPPTDPGMPLTKWIELFSGVIADVAATGQCRWLAFYAALRNTTEGLNPPTEPTATAANELKKQVLNGMIANLADEARINKGDTVAEKKASGQTTEEMAEADSRL
ncbi:hypothetical protein PC110_g15020 [Phytophthora cactorum]|nr:hypothetical protein PC113_g23053 [Phytophthora cactorum]KAG2963795.1 hypothetical protein PC119_g25414 [Phytophthora cactorum]KAG3193165.1 hypothetical protein PC128_g10258 [Phytophthora cactorum]RAW28590.1 hypothetical protein PC110_g15020 [Phytophthora cactorum]